MNVPDNAELLQLLAEHTPAAIAIFDRDMRYLITSRRWLTDYGLTNQDIIGRSHYEVFPEIPHRWKQIHQRSLAGEVQKCEAAPFPRADGTIDWVNWELHPWRQSSGDIGGILMMTQVITESTAVKAVNTSTEAALKQAKEALEIIVEERTAELNNAIDQLQVEIAQRAQVEEALKESQQRLQAILDNSPALIYLKDTQGRYLLVNRQCEAVFHINKEELEGKTDYDIFPKQIADTFRYNDQNVLAAKTPMELEEVALQDDIHTYLALKFPLCDENGVPYALCGISTDITERKAVEEELIKERNFSRTLTEACPAFFVTISADGKVQMMNPAMLNALGYTVEEVVGKDYLPMFVPETDQAGVLEILECLVKFRGSNVHTNEVLTKTGEKRLVEWHGTLVFKETGEDGCSTVDFFMAVGIDISDRQQTLAALRESEEQFRFTFEQAAVGICHISLDGHWLFVNQKVCHLLGYTQEELKALTFGDVTHPDDLNSDLEYIRQLLAGEIQSYSIQKRYIRQDGSLVWVQLTPMLVREESGKPKYFITVIQDISSRIALEKELALRQRLFDTFFNAAPAGLGIFDDQLRYVQINEALAEINGVSRQEHFGKSLREVVPSVAQALEPMYHRILIQGESFINQEVSAKTPKQPDIVRHWITSNFPLLGEDDRPLGVGVVVFEISDRKRAEEALQKSEYRNRALIQALPDLLFRMSFDGTYLDFHAPTEDSLLMRPSLFMGKKIHEVMPPEVAEFTMQNLLTAIATGEPQIYEYQIQAMDGKMRDYEARYAVSGETEALVIVRDISDKKAAEHALKASEAQLREQAQELQKTLRELQKTQFQLIQSEKMSSLGQLVAGVAHEINNPVSFIYGNITPATEYAEDLLRLLQLYQEQYPNPTREITEEIKAIDLDFLKGDFPKVLSSMKMGATRICDIVLSLRTFSRLDEAEMKEVDIHEGIESTLMILENRLRVQPNRPEIQVIKTYGNLPKVDCYAGQLNQVFMNIISNAIDALEIGTRDWGLGTGETRIDQEEEALSSLSSVPTIRICTEVRGSNHVSIRIADNGSGINEEVRRRIFDPFYTTKPIGKGTGLGLSISYQIVVEKHSGSLRCFSQMGKGTEFVIKIPIHQVHC
ncbi:PAS domain S-box protein [Funiculus sociatus GB2-A5]|uniref:histidine kinase n=1 Tax=Funiculus sociatus GB2-A5 TaxID=2933946 RepID=A0ABV0JPA2_9CYAN|nr:MULTISPECIES: PAS domain S-box protein [unclassified Trichocoleus]MBD1907955.1 PAS domain S-box protein [Trichocoleus sp. FACHB-832]MBD2064813.1 PAS domain S-box protein [Trichocoleus sp. FACHB-6]